MAVQGVFFSQNVKKAMEMVLRQVSPEPPV
jgi:hypothetical protein